MNIVIIGAGDIGLHIASIFSQFEYGIVIVDNDPFKLENVTRDLDVTTRFGSGTNCQLLEELLETFSDLFVAVTDDDETNLVACALARNLGFHQTIARVRNRQYLKQSRLHFDRLFYCDYIISPEKLTADAIANMIVVPDSIATESFAHGAVSMRTMKIPPQWNKNIQLKNRKELALPEETMVALIKRDDYESGIKKEKLIFPHGDDCLMAGDEVTFIGASEKIAKIPDLFGLNKKLPKSVVIVGGSLVGINLAETLQEYEIETTLIDKNKNKCQFLSRSLEKTTVIHHEGTDYRFLKNEKLTTADAFVAATRADEVNFLSAAAASELGAKHVIISLSDLNYMPLLKRLGINAAISPRINAANRVLSIVREKHVVSMVSLYESKAEVMEVKVSMDSKIVGIPIKHLGPELPKDFLIAVIQNRGRIFMADGSRILSPGDTVIVISSARHMNEIKKLF